MLGLAEEVMIQRMCKDQAWPSLINEYKLRSSTAALFILFNAGTTKDT